jgi:hypothetical protein
VGVVDRCSAGDGRAAVRTRKGGKRRDTSGDEGQVCRSIHASLESATRQQLSDTAHNVAGALAYLNIAKLPEHATDDVCFGRYLLIKALVEALETREHDKQAHCL